MGLPITGKIIRCDAASHSAQLMDHAEGNIWQGRPAANRLTTGRFRRPITWVSRYGSGRPRCAAG